MDILGIKKHASEIASDLRHGKGGMSRAIIQIAQSCFCTKYPFSDGSKKQKKSNRNKPKKDPAKLRKTLSKKEKRLNTALSLQRDLRLIEDERTRLERDLFEAREAVLVASDGQEKTEKNVVVESLYDRLRVLAERAREVRVLAIFQ